MEILFKAPQMTVLHTLERRKDWPVIVAAIVCPVCKAGVGEQCVQLGRKEYRSLMSPSPRLDFHQGRKVRAAKEFQDEAITKD